MKYEHLWFEEGVFKKRDVGSWKNGTTGTLVQWQPSEEFFTHTEVEIDKIKKLFKVLTCLCPGLTINLDNNGNKEVFYSENGLSDLVDNVVGDTELINSRMNMRFKEDRNAIDMVITYTSKYSLNMISYVNTGETDAGPHITQIKTILTREFNKFFKEKKWLKDKDANLSGDDLQEGMMIAFNITAPNISYDAQTKSRIVKIDMTPFNAAIAENLRYWFESNEKDIKLIFDKAISARKAREAAKKARENARENGGKKKGAKLANLPTKLIDCAINGEKAELILCEGDSAASGLVAARDGDYQAIFGLRGKMINAFKNQSEKVMANQEVNNIIKALGLQMNKNGKLIYDKNKLRYGKIIAATDGDPDGQSIRMLIAVNLWNLCPELILNGHFYIAYAPLFRITTKKNEYIYLRDASALEEYKKNHINESYQVNRMKGLGECDAQELAAVLLEEKTRNVKQVLVKDAQKAKIHLEMLMGTSVAGRRQFLLEHGNEANDLYEKGE